MVYDIIFKGWDANGITGQTEWFWRDTYHILVLQIKANGEEVIHEVIWG